MAKIVGELRPHWMRLHGRGRDKLRVIQTTRDGLHVWQSTLQIGGRAGVVTSACNLSWPRKSVKLLDRKFVPAAGFCELCRAAVGSCPRSLPEPHLALEPLPEGYIDRDEPWNAEFALMETQEDRRAVLRDCGVPGGWSRTHAPGESLRVV